MSVFDRRMSLELTLTQIERDRWIGAKFLTKDAILEQISKWKLVEGYIIRLRNIVCDWSGPAEKQIVGYSIKHGLDDFVGDLMELSIAGYAILDVGHWYANSEASNDIVVSAAENYTTNIDGDVVSAIVERAKWKLDILNSNVKLNEDD